MASISSCTKHRSVGSSDKHRMHRCPWCRFFRQASDAPVPLASVLPVLLTEELAGCCPETREGRLPLDPRRGGPSGLATPIFSFFLSSLEPKSLRMIILIIILVQVLCCHSITKITRNGINGAMFVTVRYIHELSLTLEHSMPISSPAAQGLISPQALRSRVLQTSNTWLVVLEYFK